jgi:hypothetical protein
VAAGTYDLAQATKACVAYTGNSAVCGAGMCQGPGGNKVVCSSGAGNCICWNYQGTNVGHVYDDPSNSCLCPVTASPAWN